jgi:hypothetical protein
MDRSIPKGSFSDEESEAKQLLEEQYDVKCPRSREHTEGRTEALVRVGLVAALGALLLVSNIAWWLAWNAAAACPRVENYCR